MKRRSSFRAAALTAVAIVGLAATACAPPGPGGGPAPVNWSFKGTNIVVNNVQDEVCLVFCVNTEDEAYLMQVWFRAKVGVPNSAQAGVIKGGPTNDLGAGDSSALSGSRSAPVNFNGVAPLDVLDLLNTNNALEIFGTYTWAAEEDFFDSLTGGAQSVADIFRTALNGTIAEASIPADENAIVQLVLDSLFNNGLGTPFNLIVSNLPCLGTCDDVLGGGLYVGVGATGTLGAGIDAVLATTAIPNVSIPIVTVPPDIQGGGIYTMTGTRNFTNSFSGADGVHTYSFRSGPA